MGKKNSLHKKVYLNLWRTWGKISASSRTLPNYIIIGAQKAGTSSLDLYLRQHPQIVPSFKKEVKYFGCNFDKGLTWYKSHFPKKSKMKQEGTITGEASPYYIFHPSAPKRIYDTLPNVKLIAILRNPIDRAFSHFNMNILRERETRSFEEAIESEIEIIEHEKRKIISDDSYSVYNHKHYSYLSRGIYADQLLEWFKYFPKPQLLILKSENLFTSAVEVVNKTTDFLNLSQWEFTDRKIYGVGNYSELSVPMRNKLQNFFNDHNERLNLLLEKKFHWN